MNPSGRAVVAGLVGWPIAHSLSPLIHNAWLDAAGLDGLYAPFAVSTDRFEPFIEGLRGGAVRGLNITTPYKERAMVLADRADGHAKDVNAANLLLFTPDGGIDALNVDGFGLIAALDEQAPQLHLDKAVVVILGAGGAARSAAVMLAMKGVPDIRVVSRTLSRAEDVSGYSRGYAWSDMPSALAGADVVINATTAGREDSEPLAVSLDGLKPTAAAVDMNYHPLRSAFLLEAEQRGLTTVDGLAMLIGQARPSFEAFFGRPPPEIDVRALALEALR